MLLRILNCMLQYTLTGLIMQVIILVNFDITDESMYVAICLIWCRLKFVSLIHFVWNLW
jgi:hypothetical protein